MQVADICGNCKTRLVGVFCHVCGQKSATDRDRSFRHLIELFLTEMTSLDGKLWRSLRGLGRPGFLAREYLQGRRAPYLSPVTVFLLVNMFYFVYPVMTDFELPFSDHVPGRVVLALNPDASFSSEQRDRLSRNPGQFHSRWSASWVESKVAQRSAVDKNFSLKAAGQLYDAKSEEISKFLIVVHVPFLGIALMLMFWRSGLFYVEHVVTALLLFATLLLVMQSMTVLLQWIPIADSLTGLVRRGTVLVLAMVSVLFMRCVYQQPFWYCALATLGFFASLLWVNLIVYRTLQFLLIFALV